MSNVKVLEPTELNTPLGPLRRLYPLAGIRLLMSDVYRLWLMSKSTIPSLTMELDDPLSFVDEYFGGTCWV